MADQAKVTEVDVIAAFRGRLVMFMENAGRALDEVDSELRRTRTWLEGETLTHWQGEMKHRQRKLDAAEQELLTARLSTLKESESVQQMAVRKARRAVREAEEKLRVIKRWSRNFESAVYPLARHLGQLRHHLGKELPQAATQLAEIVKTLDAYTELGRATPSAPPSDSPQSSGSEPPPADDTDSNPSTEA